MAENASTPPGAKLPRGVPFIIGNEAAERFSYYGMLSILTIYLSKHLQMGEDRGREVMHIFATGVYFLPLFGAWLADKWLGRYWTILTISLFYCLGHGALALFEGNLPGVYLGLTLIAIGAGGIKPCVSAFVGDQFPAGNEKALTRVYGWFYWSVNFGATFGFALIPMLREKKGYSWAFGVPGIAMAVATFIFWLGRKHYLRQPPARQSHQAGVMSVLWFAFNNQSQRRAGEKYLDVALAKYSPEEVNAVRAVGRIVIVFLCVPVFFALYNQVNSTWVLQGEKMTPFEVLGFKVDGERMQAVGSILVMIWVPIMTYIIYPLFEKLRLRPTPLRRMAVGMVLAGITYIISAILQTKIDVWWDDAAVKYAAATAALDSSGPLGPPFLQLVPPPSLAWQLVPYVVLVAGEVLVSATGLEYAFAEAPKSMRSIIMSFWLCTIAGGHFLIALLTWLNSNFVKLSGTKELYAYAGLMFIVTVIFMLIAATVGKKRPTTAA
jgi:POT family proton-dependent oligopeptide transporter